MSDSRRTARAIAWRSRSFATLKQIERDDFSACCDTPQTSKNAGVSECSKPTEESIGLNEDCAVGRATRTDLSITLQIRPLLSAFARSDRDRNYALGPVALRKLVRNATHALLRSTRAPSRDRCRLKGLPTNVLTLWAGRDAIYPHSCGVLFHRVTTRMCHGRSSVASTHTRASVATILQPASRSHARSVSPMLIISTSSRTIPRGNERAIPRSILRICCRQIQLARWQ